MELQNIGDKDNSDRIPIASKQAIYKITTRTMPINHQKSRRSLSTPSGCSQQTKWA